MRGFVFKGKNAQKFEKLDKSLARNNETFNKSKQYFFAKIIW